MNQVRSLYVHIPFCERKCEYCDFASISGLNGVDEYVASLERELAFLAPAAEGSVLDTIFFGGGTPGLVDPAYIARLFRVIRENYVLSPGMEATIEANPSSVDAPRVAAWLDAGFNRVSLGVQSLHDPTLRFLGRVHDAEHAVKAIGVLRAGGVANLNCDLIYAVPGLTNELWRETLAAVIAERPDHVSAYELTVEPGTPLHTGVRRGRVIPVADGPAIEQHWIAVDTLEKDGYRQYEISNFATAGRECRHNLAYWNNHFYLAAGVGAHGHLPPSLAARTGMRADEGVAVRYWNTRKVGRYSSGEWREDYETVTQRQHEEERLMVGLRLQQGVTVDGATMNRALSLANAGLLNVTTDRIVLTRRGQEVLNEVAARLAA
jgi:putative oxygen-independent coproporphyrinogen III oxidase